MRVVAPSVFLAALLIVSACVGDDPAIDTSPGTPEAGGGNGDGTAPVQDAAADTADGATACASGTLCGTSCIDTTTSADNCGRCANSCGAGAKCSAGLCQPVIVASNVAAPLGVAVAMGSAFWVRSGAVERCPVTGCTGVPTSITDSVVVGASQPAGTTIVTDGNQVAWIADGPQNGRDVYSCSVTGCNGFNPKTASGLTDAATQLALEGATLFVAQSTGTQRSGPLATLALAGMAGTGSDVPTGIAADAVNTYVAGVALSAAGVDRCTRPSCANKTRLFVDAKYIAVGGPLLVATSSAGIVKCAVTGCGGAASALSPDDKTAGAIAASAGYVAWVIPGSTTVADGTVRLCALPNCKGGPRTIAMAQEHPVSVTIANGFVYWANSGVGATMGSIWRAGL